MGFTVQTALRSEESLKTANEDQRHKGARVEEGDQSLQPGTEISVRADPAGPPTFRKKKTPLRGVREANTQPQSQTKKGQSKGSGECRKGKHCYCRKESGKVNYKKISQREARGRG